MTNLIEKDIKAGNKYYFYNGFNEPKEINPLSVELMSNYLGDVTNDFLEELEAVLSYCKAQGSFKYFNEEIGFNIYRNPALEELQLINTNVYGLSKNDYLDKFLG